ncbi:MAG TPA: rhomboid family intramembrane serine protease [Methylomirabilota bacterium]
MTLLALIGINVLVSLLGFRALNPERPQDTRRAESFLFIPWQVARGENGLGMLLAHFAHAGFGHLLFNMIALYSFGGPVLAALGPARFLLIYVVAGLGSDLVVFALHKEDPTYRCLGASGSVFGILMAAVVLDPSTSVVMFFVPIPIPGPVFMLGYVVIAVFLILKGHRGSVSHEGHLGGAIIGLAVTGLLAPRGLGPLVRWLTQWVT